MEEVALVAEGGRPTGSAAARRLRRAGRVPAVLYGHGIEPQALAVDARELRLALSGEGGLNALLALEVDGGRHTAMARQVQRDPIRRSVEHVDFVVVRRDEVVTAEVPVHLVGEALDVHRHDGVVDQQLFSLPLNAKPLDLPASVDVDISGLAIGDSVRVGDLVLPPGVTTDVDPDEPVVMAEASAVAAEMEAEEAATEAAEAAAGEPGEGRGGPGPEGEAAPAGG